METRNKLRNQCIAVLTGLFAVTLMRVYEGLVGLVVILYMIAITIVIVHSTLYPEVWNENEEEEKYE